MDESKLEEESTDWSSDDEDTVNGNGNYDSIRCMSPQPTCQPPDRLAPQDQLGCHAIRQMSTFFLSDSADVTSTILEGLRYEGELFSLERDNDHIMNMTLVTL